MSDYMCGHVNDASEHDGISGVFRSGMLRDRRSPLPTPRFPRNAVEINFKRIARHVRKLHQGARMRNRLARANTLSQINNYGRREP